MKRTLDNMKLCYVRNSKAFFTTQKLEKQWGDDWDDAPYEHNAGEPYTGEGWKILKIFFEVDLMNEPCDNYANSPYSVEAINKKTIPWLSSDSISIWAGTTLREFIRIIKKAGGEIYLNASINILALGLKSIGIQSIEAPDFSRGE